MNYVYDPQNREEISSISKATSLILTSDQILNESLAQYRKGPLILLHAILEEAHLLPSPFFNKAKIQFSSAR